MLPAAAAAQPFALDQARCYIQRLLSIINERNAQLELLKTHLDQKTELCKLHEDRAERAEANAAAARDKAQQLLIQNERDAPTLPGLSPADLAALNTLPPAERDATWLRRVFVRGDLAPARAPLGPFELAGLYLDAFAWTRTAASGTDIVAAVARVFPGVQLVPTECGPRFRGLVRAQVAPAGPQEAQARQLRTERSAAALDAYASAAEASSSSLPTSPRLPLPPPMGKRKRSPEPEPTSKRVRTAQGGAAKAEEALDMRMLHDVGTSPLRVRARPEVRIPPAEMPPRSSHSVGPQTLGVFKTYVDAEVQAHLTPPPKPTFSTGTQTIDVCKTYADAEVQVCDARPHKQTYAEAGVQACDVRPEVVERPPDRAAHLADLARLPHAHIPPDLPPLRVPRGILESTLPDRAVRIVQNLQRGEHERELEGQETFRQVGEHLEYLGTYVFRPVCVGYSRAVHEALARAVLDEEIRVLSRLGVGDSDSEGEDGEVGLSDGD